MLQIYLNKVCRVSYPKLSVIGAVRMPMSCCSRSVICWVAVLSCRAWHLYTQHT